MINIIPILLILIVSTSALAYQDDSKEQTQNIRVVNFPKVQKIEGDLKVTGPISHSTFNRREKITIPPVDRNDVGNFLDLGSIETDGFTNVVISLQVEVKSSSFSAGSVGAILTPEEKPIIDAFKQELALLVPLEASVEVKPRNGRYFSSASIPHQVAFPKYKVFLFNSTNVSVEANLYMYLKN